MLELTLKPLGVLDGDKSVTSRYLYILNDECEREINLIGDLLNPHLGADVEPLFLTTIAMEAWVPTVVEPLIQQFNAWQQTLEMNISSGLPPIETDLVILSKIIKELLINASKHTPAAETITVSVQHRINSFPYTFLIRISNSGVEIPHHEFSRIFEKFYRIPTDDPWKQDGVGIGLALMEKRVKQLGGTIHVTK